MRAAEDTAPPPPASVDLKQKCFECVTNPDETTCRGKTFALVTLPVRVYVLYFSRFSLDDLWLRRKTCMGWFIPIRSMTLPTIAWEPCLPARKVECFETPFFTIVWSCVMIVWLVLPAVFDQVQAGPDRMGWEFDFSHWAVVLCVAFWIGRIVLCCFTFTWSYEKRTTTYDHEWLWRPMWFCYSVGYPILATAAPVYGIYHRDGQRVTVATDALYWSGFTIVLLEMIVFKLPFVPAHVIWILALVLLDAMVTLVAYGSTRLNFGEGVVAFWFLILWYGLVSLAALMREKFGGSSPNFSQSAEIFIA